MNIRFANGGVTITAKTRKERAELQEAWGMDNLHFACKALWTQKNGRLALLIEPSFQRWKPKRYYPERKKSK